MLIFKNRIKYSKNSEKINLVAEKQLKFFTKNKTNLDSFFSLTKNNSRKND
ncbi:hypothetical protein FACS189459_2570 [Bacilli bacterium]|nr:hypothetical protein FACS189459_2570 [Bacilli bacterium]